MWLLNRFVRYAWAFPATAFGLPLVFLALLSGGRATVVQGVIEAHGGLVATLLRRWLLIPAAAMTLGHVIVGRDATCLEQSRRHEHVHVRQYERWGPLMLPIYLTASLVLYVRGLDPYLDNPFEREAFEQS
jgi:hypothetical protein